MVVTGEETKKAILVIGVSYGDIAHNITILPRVFKRDTASTTDRMMLANYAKDHPVQIAKVKKRECYYKAFKAPGINYR